MLSLPGINQELMKRGYIRSKKDNNRHDLMQWSHE